jgi:hypothetical protein
MSVTVYMPLLDEGTDVCRPVSAIPFGECKYRILGKMPEDEEWAFRPGSIVIGRTRLVSGEDTVIVEERIKSAEFTALELAVLQSIFDETPELAPGLRQQLDLAIVANRENTGVGFFTSIEVLATAEPVESPRTLGSNTFVRVAGLKYGLGFVLLLAGGFISLLDGHSCASENTTNLPLSDVDFQITTSPFYSGG